jgi:hypothetical protein
VRGSSGAPAGAACLLRTPSGCGITFPPGSKMGRASFVELDHYLAAKVLRSQRLRSTDFPRDVRGGIPPELARDNPAHRALPARPSCPENGSRSAGRPRRPPPESTQTCGRVTVTAAAGTGRVEVWRGGCRSNVSVAAPFVWRCLTASALAPSPHPAHRTGHADLPHPALGQNVTPSPTARHAQVGSDVRAQSARRGARVDRPRPCVA